VTGRYRKYLGWEDSQGRVWRGRKPDGWPIDTKCADGFTCNGFRQVDKNFTIRFGGSRWTHESWSVGLVVYVSLDDPLGAQINTISLASKWRPDNLADDWPSFCREHHDV